MLNTGSKLSGGLKFKFDEGFFALFKLAKQEVSVNARKPNWQLGD